MAKSRTNSALREHQNYMKPILITLSIGILSSWSALSAPQFESHYNQAVVKAKKADVPYAVMVHGSTWHPASKMLMEKIWTPTVLGKRVSEPIILANVNVRQGLTKDQAESEAASRKGWSDKGISSYPALQFYSSEGKLLQIYQGKQIRAIANPAAMSALLNSLSKAAQERSEYLAQLESAAVKADKNKQIKILNKMLKLPLKHEEKMLEMLKAADPQDRSGWQARLKFSESGFLRHITKLLSDDKSDDALKEVNELIANDSFTPSQTAAILGAKGKILVAKEDYVAAWDQFKAAYEADPYGSTGKTMLNYGEYKALVPSRGGVTKDSALYGKEIGENISRDFASYKQSSNSSDDGKEHESLMKGAVAGQGFAFHTDREKDAHIIIDLGAESEVIAVEIVNRKQAKLRSRAASLKMELSSDKLAWTPVWRAEKAQAQWDVILKKPMNARYIKLSLDSSYPEYLHLSSVNVFGDRK